MNYTSKYVFTGQTLNMASRDAEHAEKQLANGTTFSLKWPINGRTDYTVKMDYYIDGTFYHFRLSNDERRRFLALLRKNRNK